MNVQNIERMGHKGKTVVLYKQRLISYSRTLCLEDSKNDVYDFSVYYNTDRLYSFSIKIIYSKNNRIALYSKPPLALCDFVRVFTRICKTCNLVNDVVYRICDKYSILISDSTLLYVSNILNKKICIAISGMMAVKHFTVYHKDVMYVVAYSITINKVNDADDEYVFQMGFFGNVNRRKIHILKETEQCLQRKDRIACWDKYICYF
jgi:hypothetical protein